MTIPIAWTVLCHGGSTPPVGDGLYRSRKRAREALRMIEREPECATHMHTIIKVGLYELVSADEIQKETS